ncbi:2-oxoacid dehydrogenases acyltransferase-domain-containing protein [Mycena rebaudengoi]|nr:2-oxoacid dehydrogenases acyltransferase-domain-containing protein [Mycena rebaudengoi]
MVTHNAPPLLHGGERDLLPSLPLAPAPTPRRTAPAAPPRLVPSPPSSFHVPPPTALAPPPAVFSPRRTTPIPHAGVPPRRVVHRTPPPYAITGTTTTATSVLVQATYNPSSTSYPTTSTSSTPAYPSSAYPTSTYPATTRSSNSTPRSSSRPPPPPPPTTLKVQESTPPPPPPARCLHPLDPAFSGDKRGAAVSDVDTLVTPSVRHYTHMQGVDLARSLQEPGAAGTWSVQMSTRFWQQEREGCTGGARPHVPGDVEGNGEAACPPPAPQREHPCALPPFLSNSSTDTSPTRLSPAEQSAHSLGLTLPTPAVPAAARYTRLTYLPFLLKSLARAMIDWPLFRASIAPTPSPSTPSTPTPKSTSRHLTICPHADIALVLSTPSGLYTPVLRPVDTRTPYALASQIAELAALGCAVPPALTPKHLAGGATLTVSNVGSTGRGRWASPVLVPGGGVAIVALGRAEWVWDVSGEYPRACAEGASGYGDGYGAFEGQRRLKLNVSWAADHRVVEGAEMAAFVESWRGWVEAPGRALTEGV